MKGGSRGAQRRPAALCGPCSGGSSFFGRCLCAVPSGMRCTAGGGAALKSGCQNKMPYRQKTSWGQQGRNHILTPFCGLSRSFTKGSYAFICHVGQQQKIYIQFILCVDACPPHQNIVPHPKPLPQCLKRQRYPSILPFDISITRKHENMPSGIHL